MQEQLLQFIWHRKLFRADNLVTTQGHAVEIIHCGIPNQDQGPDFLQARVRLDEQLWAGHVEIHIRSSAWYLHSHHQDTHYNNVILHVVWQEDQPVITESGIRIPCLELEGKVDKQLLDRYRLLMDNEEWIPCASAIAGVPSMIKTSWLERVLAERLEEKTNRIAQAYDRCGNDWEQTFFVMLCRHMGAPANSDAMENLGYKVPLNILSRHGDRPDQIEAILFGVAGMLEKSTEETYPLHLKKEFDFLKKKYGLSIIPALQWKFLRMRPAHFPTIRIAQLSVIISRTRHFIPFITEDVSIKSWMHLFNVSPADAYWENHYHFKSASPPSHKTLGKETAIGLLINLVAPFMFFYGKMQGPSILKEKAVSLLGSLPAEKNAVLKEWKKNGWPALDAGQSQALLQLKKHYCDEKKCLHCAVGLKVIKEERAEM
jgi:hypothetical protein